jgi:pimeloyl-ACP methyl ester carboxylesterase
MPQLTTDDGVKLHYEEVGSGAPIILVHEFAGDCRSWEPQMRYFGRRYRCIAYNARGFTPSDVPEDVEKYSQARARDDIKAVLDALRIAKAHVIGLSMGGFAWSSAAAAMAHPRTSARSSPRRPRPPPAVSRRSA